MSSVQQQRPAPRQLPANPKLATVFCRRLAPASFMLMLLVTVGAGCKNETQEAKALPTEQAPSPTISTEADTAAGLLTKLEAVPDAELGVKSKKKTACGVDLNLPEKGMEAKFLDFVQNADRKADKDAWFTFDRLTFDPGKAKLDVRKSGEQLANIVAIMKCYKTLRVKIEGHSDNVGDTNALKSLSATRAAVVKATLIGMGVEPPRVESEGFGDSAPMSANDTEEGRAKNRRMVLRVLVK